MIRKIGIKLIVIVGITAFVTIGVFSYFSITTQSDALLAEVERQANQLGETIKYSIRYDMLLNQRDRITKIIQDIGVQKSIRDIRILNKVGEIIYSSRPGDVGKMVDKKAESCYACHNANKPLSRLPIKERTRIYRTASDSSRILGIINPIYNEPSCWQSGCHAHSADQTVLGVLDVTLSLEDVDNQITRSEIDMLIFAISAIIVLSLIIGFFVRKWVSVPVNSILKATDEVSSGNLNYSIEDIRNDELGSLASSFNNMTKKLSEARLQLFRSDRMASLGRLAAGVAHEINNPLTGVLTYSSFLLKRTQNNPDLQEDLKVIVRETKRSREIVKSLLDFARQSVPKKNKANINEIIEQAISVVENQLTIKKIKLIKDLDSALPQITIDNNQMQQVFINLIVNAADAIPENGGTIRIISSSLNLSPIGIAHIKKALCIKRHDLIDNESKIDGLSMIKLKVKTNGEEGFVYLDPVYGKSRNRYGIEFNRKKDISIECPRCSNSLINEKQKCPVCGSAVYRFETPPNGFFEGCINRECGWQKWEDVDAAGQKEYIEVKVIDNGSGIPNDILPRIFEPFFSTKGQKGTGLGLAVIWGIIDNHDGTIKVESELNQGTTFTIRLPINSGR